MAQCDQLKPEVALDGFWGGLPQLHRDCDKLFSDQPVKWNVTRVLTTAHMSKCR